MLKIFWGIVRVIMSFVFLYLLFDFVLSNPVVPFQTKVILRIEEPGAIIIPYTQKW